MYKFSHILALCALSASTSALPQGMASQLIAPHGGTNINLHISSWTGPNCAGDPASVTTVLYDTDTVTASTVVSFKVNRAGEAWEQIDFSTFNSDHKSGVDKKAECMQFVESVYQTGGGILPDHCYNLSKNGGKAQVCYSGPVLLGYD